MGQTITTYLFPTDNAPASAPAAKKQKVSAAGGKTKSKSTKAAASPSPGRRRESTTGSTTPLRIKTKSKARPSKAELDEAATTTSGTARLERWYVFYNQLVDYKDSHEGNCSVPQHFDENRPLGAWVGAQRQAKHKLDDGKKSALTLQQVKRLDEIGFDWGTRRVSFQKRYEQLVEYKKKHGGSCDVPEDDKEYPDLAKWVSIQRKNYGTWKKNPGKMGSSGMTQERVDKLAALGFKW